MLILPPLGISTVPRKPLIFSPPCGQANRLTSPLPEFTSMTIVSLTVGRSAPGMPPDLRDQFRRSCQRGEPLPTQYLAAMIYAHV